MTKQTLIKKMKRLNACVEGLEWLKQQKETDVKKLFLKAVEEGHAGWANWAMSRLLPKIDKIRFAVFAAKQVLHIYEGKYPNDKRPREAINAAMKYIKTPNAYAAYADDAAYAAHAAAAAAYADDAAYAAHAAAAAAYAADKKKLQLKIIKHGIKLLEW